MGAVNKGFNHLANFPQEVDKLVYLLLRHAMDSHQSSIAQHLGNFMERLVGQDQGMFGGDDLDYEIAGQATRS